MNAMKKTVAALAVCLPLAGFAQTPAAEAAKPADAAMPAQPAAPAAEPAKPAPPAGGVKATWYGFILANFFFDSGTLTGKDYPGNATFNPAGAGGAVLFSARQSRFGVTLTSNDETLTGATVTGQGEFDFKGGSTSSSSTAWNANLLRMRLGTVTATWKGEYGKFAIMAGQHYGLVNGLFAESVGWVADPIFWQAGNIWRRTPQIRLSYGGTFDMVSIGVDLAALSPADAPPTGSVPGAGLDYGAGNRSRNPELEGHVAVTVKPGPNMSFMVGGGINRTKRTFDTGANEKTLNPSMIGVEADFSVPFVQVKGEFYTGKGEEDSYNGASASVVGAAGSRSLVKSSGYWAQLILKPVPVLSLWGGIGSAKGDSGDLDLITVAADRNATRAKNTQTAGGVIVNASKSWRFGVEYAMLKTEWLGAAVGDPNVERKVNQLAVSTQLKW
jgi:hypothetical protein